MDEIQLDYATLVSVYQTKVNDLTNQLIISEAKNIVLSKKLQELLDNNSVAVKPASSKKSVSTDKDAGNY